MFRDILRAAVLAVLTYAIWNIARWLLGRSPLDNIPGPPSNSFIIGNLAQFHAPDAWEFHKTLEQEYQGVVKIHGLLGGRLLHVFDTAALHSILVKDQDIYEETPMFLSLTGLLFGKGILSTTGDEHRRHRKIMLPAFSTPNLRTMMPVLYEVADRLRDGLIAPQLQAGPQELDMYSIMSRTSLEFIGRVGIGYSFDSMTSGEEPTDQYAESLKDLVPATNKLAVLLPTLPLVSSIGTPALREFIMKLIPSKTLRELSSIVKIMDTKATALVHAKNEAIRRGEVQENSKDMMSLLLKNNMTADKDMHVTNDELVAQTSMIIQAATDTSSSALSRLIHLLVLHPDVQEKLRAEILTTEEHMGHDVLVGLPYLDAVIHETLRLYPPVAPAMSRAATKDAILPLAIPITGIDGRPIHSIPVPKGTGIYIGISAANHNKTIWGEDALEFKPERWTNGKAKGVTIRMPGVYGNMMTFVGGGRSCIGFKFAQLELKIVLSVLLRAFRFSSASAQIKWKMDSTATPSVDDMARLPIRVENL
ncbi:cytochrome P450 [Mycena rebaudengoi]|nr:cytochrome P450 [Mycena rebaudengoi]